MISQTSDTDDSLRKVDTMQDIVETLKSALLHEDLSAAYLTKISFVNWYENFPVGIVHDAKRITEPSVVNILQEHAIFDGEGRSRASYPVSSIELLQKEAPTYIKQVGFLCCDTPFDPPYTFREKHSNDFWKKVEDPGSFKAVIEITRHEAEEDICTIESHLRDLIRSSKEVPSLKNKPFIWVAVVPPALNLRKILMLYFGNNYEMLVQKRQISFIAWSQTLQSIDMRDFVCLPS